MAFKHAIRSACLHGPPVGAAARMLTQLMAVFIIGLPVFEEELAELANPGVAMGVREHPTTLTDSALLPICTLSECSEITMCGRGGELATILSSKMSAASRLQGHKVPLSEYVFE